MAYMQPFVNDASVEWVDLGTGVKRKIMVYDDKAMLVKVAFETGGIGALHHHYHSQLSYVASGSFEVEIDGQKQVLNQGDVFYAKPHVVHGVICLQAGELVDVFSPYREDFL